jgi:hypothetical protein
MELDKNELIMNILMFKGLSFGEACGAWESNFLDCMIHKNGKFEITEREFLVKIIDLILSIEKIASKQAYNEGYLHALEGNKNKYSIE